MRQHSENEIKENKEKLETNKDMIDFRHVDHARIQDACKDLTNKFQVVMDQPLALGHKLGSQGKGGRN